MDGHPLKVFLQNQLASDASSVLHLPNVFSLLSSEVFLPSAHQQKWIARLNSLVHSKDSAARWAGLSLATQTCILSKTLMMENAQSWTGAALTMLSKPEPLPTLKAAIRLLLQIFSAATDVPEFQRQLATPNAPKFSFALIALTERPEVELRLLAFNTLSKLVPAYPTLHKSLQGQLLGLCLRELNGSSPKPTETPILQAASKLYSAVPVTGGKVSAASLWRKSINETLTFGWEAFIGLRTTFPHNARPYPSQTRQPSQDDPMVRTPLNMDRLHCAVVVLGDLLKFSTCRPVQVPAGTLVDFVQALLSCTSEEKVDGHVDTTTRILEESSVPKIWALANELLVSLSRCLRYHLTPYISRLLTVVVFHLERPLTSAQRVPFLKSIIALVTDCHDVHHPIVPTRLTKALLAIVSLLLRPQSDDQNKGGTPAGNRSKKGKKRVREYEGDEVFKISSDVLFPGRADGEMILLALEALRKILRNEFVARATYSVASRIILAIHLSLPSIPSSQLSPDADLRRRIISEIHILCLEVGTGTSSVLSKSLALVIHELNNEVYGDSNYSQRALDLLLHPRVPPLLRSLPQVEALSLYPAEEGVEEKAVREGFKIAIPNEVRLASAPAAFHSVQTRTPDNNSVPASAVLPSLPASFTLPKTIHDGALARSSFASSQSIHRPTITSTLPALIEGTAGRESESAPSFTLSEKVTEAAPLAPPNPSDSTPTDSLPTAAHAKTKIAAIPVPHPAPPSLDFSLTAPMDEDEDEEMPSIDMGSDSE